MVYAIFLYCLLALAISAIFLFLRLVWFVMERIRTNSLLERIEDKYDLICLDSRDYMNVIAEVFRRKGYKVRISDRCGEDSNGLELDDFQYVEVFKTQLNNLLELETAMKLAWCMRINSIHRGQIVTLGNFKQNTRSFCFMHVISCVNGDQLLAMCKEAQRKNAVPDFTN